MTDASVRAAVEPMLARVAELPHVTDVVSPYATGGGARAISPDATIAFATVTYDQQAQELPVAAIERVVETAPDIRSADLEVELGGQATAQTQEPSVSSATAIGLAAAVIVLLLSFGSFVAIGLSVVTALFGLGIGISLIALGTQVIDIVDFSTDLALMLGLGVGIDYALFIVTRFRDAYRANGSDTGPAIELAMNSAGRAVVFAGATVVIALMGMFALGISFLYGVALATSAVVLLVLAASITLLPALLSLTGHRVGKLRSRRWRHDVAAQASSRAGRLSSSGGPAGLRSPRPRLCWHSPRLRSACASAPATPATTRPRPPPARRTTCSPRASATASTGRARRWRAWPEQTPCGRLLGATLRETPGVASVAAPSLNPARDAATIFVYPNTSPQSEATTELVTRLREDVIPAAEQATGTMSSSVAQPPPSRLLECASDKLPLFIGIVVLLSALLLLVVFRSLLIPLQAAAMNLLSIAASLGVIVAIFQKGWLAGLIGVEPGPIEAFIPVMVFAIVFGLSMDYEVFLVSRIHEEWQHRGDNSAAVREGLVRTGRVITAAAAIMIVVFASFASGDLRILKLFGVALATAVFLDAFVIRMVLLPAVFQLLGSSTWWFPRWLDLRLPRLAIEPPATQPAPALEEAA